MSTVSVYNMEGAKIGEVELKAEIFDIEVKENLVHAAVVAQLANKRQGTQSAKTRSEVRGGGRKPWRQKGTGHARQGSIRAAQWKGGGIIFAPKPRNYEIRLNKKEKKIALKSALTSKAKESKIYVIDDIKVDEIKTKTMVALFNKLEVKKALVILKDNNKSVIYSTRNIPDVKTAQTNTINVFDILKYDNIVVDQEALKIIEEVYA